MAEIINLKLTMNYLAKLISYATHPFILFILPFSLIQTILDEAFNLDPSLKLLAIVQLPLLILLLTMVKSGYVSNFNVSQPSQRTRLYKIFIPALIILVALFIAMFPDYTETLLIILSIAMVQVFLLKLIYKKYRIKGSYHMAMQGTLLSIALYFYSPVVSFILLVLCGVVAWGRITIKEHSNKEVLIGWIIGIIPTLILLKLLIN